MAKRFTRLTRPAIRALKPSQALTEHGITFERKASGDGVYSVNVMVDGKRIHRVIGRESEGVTRQQAEDFIARVRTDARRNRLDLPEGRKTSLSFLEAADRYIERLEHEAGKNIAAKRRQIDQHLSPFFRSSRLQDISSFDIERYKKSRCDAGAKPATVNRELAVLSHLFRKGLEWGWIKSLPARIVRFKEENGRIVYLTNDQCAVLERAAAADQNGDVHAFVMIGLRTGMRHSEILRIKIDHVDLSRKVIWIPKAKAGAREQPVTADLADYLEKRIAMLPPGSEWLFPSPGSMTGHVHTIRKAFRRSIARAGLNPDEITPHVLRHTAVTHLVQAGVDLPTVQRISGHKTLAMVARYAHQNGAHVQQAMSKLQERFEDGRAVKKAGGDD